jgi:hypothetical protein
VFQWHQSRGYRPIIKVGLRDQGFTSGRQWKAVSE